MRAEEHAPALRSIAEIRGLPLQEIGQGRTADIEAVVQIYDFVSGGSSFQSLYVGDGRDGVYLNCRGKPLDLRPGQRIRARGVVGPGLFAPELLDPEITPLEYVGLPEPLHPSYDELASGSDDCRWVEVQGVVRSAGVRSRRLCIQLGIGPARLAVTVAGEPDVTERAERLIDAVVRVRGACRTYFNSQRQAIDVGLYCAGLEAFEVLDPALPADRMPLARVRELLTFSRDARPGRRVKVHGTVTCQSPGEMLFIEDETRGLTVRTNRREPLSAGDTVEVLGFPASGVSTPVMDDGVYRVVAHGATPKPREILAADAASGRFEANFVSLKARLLEDARKGAQRTLWLQSGSGVFQATQALADAESFRPLPPQSEVVVPGICLAHGPLKYRPDFGWTAPAFELLVPASAKVEILRRPPWWTPPRILALLAVVAACLVATAAWARALRKRVRQQTELICRQVSEQAALRERNRIARELHDTLAQGFAATAFELEALGEELVSVSAAARNHLNMALTMVRHSLVEARRSVAGLRAEELGRRDLPHALRAAGELIVANAPVRFEFACVGEVSTLAPGHESHLLRIGQEAVANAVRHAGAQTIRMELRYEPDAVALRVADDGKGFHPDAAQAAEGRFGLRGIAERAAEIGGAWRVESEIGAGSTVTVRAPRLASVGVHGRSASAETGQESLSSL